MPVIKNSADGPGKEKGSDMTAPPSTVQTSGLPAPFSGPTAAPQAGVYDLRKSYVARRVAAPMASIVASIAFDQGGVRA